MKNLDRTSTVRNRKALLGAAVLAVVSASVFWCLDTDKTSSKVALDNQDTAIGNSLGVAKQGSAGISSRRDAGTGLAGSDFSNQGIVDESLPRQNISSTPSTPLLVPGDRMAVLVKRDDLLGSPSGPMEVEPAVATVSLKGVQTSFEPNSMGSFPRLNIEANEKASVTVSYPKGKAEEFLSIQCEDGGSLDNKTVIQQGKLDGTRAISFQFKAGIQEGIYRVTLRKGFDEKQLDFWVGPEVPLKPITATK